MNSKTYYLAGPMSDRPQFNFPLFYKVADQLRVRGFSIISPAELDDLDDALAALGSSDGRQNPDGSHIHTTKTWGDFLARDVKIVADGSDGIIFLPEWETSRGARLEAFVGCLRKNGFEFYALAENLDLIRLERAHVLNTIMEATSEQE